ncbi:MAG: alanine-zipper protein [Stellaceae bacterium]
MRNAFTRIGVFTALIAAPVLLSGCAATTRTQWTSVRHTAHRAMATAEHALSVAQDADQKADHAISLAQEANEKVDRMFQHHLRK